MKPNKSSSLNSENWLRKENAIICRVDVKPYNLQELCRIYGISLWTIKQWLKPILPKLGAKIGRYFTVLQVEKMFLHWGPPYSLQEVNSS